MSGTERRARKRDVLVVALATATLASLVVGMTALAFWTSTGSAAAVAAVGTLEPATIAAPSTSSGNVSITWTAQAETDPASIAADVTYTLERRVGGGSFAAATDGACAGALPFATDSCVDTPSAPGDYAYRVVAHLASWTATSNEVTVAVTFDNAPPATSIAFPLDGTSVDAVAYGSGCVPAGVCGSASDPSGVAAVRVSVQREGGGYWTGTGFDGFSEYFQDATLLLPGATSTSWSLPLALPPDGRYVVRVTAEDAVGNDSAPAVTSNSTFAIDTQGPVTSLATTPATPDGSSGWFRRADVQFTLSAADPTPGTGVAMTTYSLDGGPETAYTGPVTISTPGDHVVGYRSVDGAGNVGPAGSARIALDDAAPTTAFATTPAAPDGTDGWYRTATTFTLTPTDATSGVAVTRYRIDAGPDAVYAGPVALTEGTHVVTYWSEDVAGNAEPATSSAEIRVDTTAPGTTFATTPAAPDGSNGWFRQTSVSFTLTGADATSGIASLAYRIDGGPVQAYTGPAAVSTPGTHVVNYWSVDRAGNTGAPQTGQIELDAVAPTTTAATAPAAPDGSSGWFRRSSVLLTLTASDATSGVAATTYAVDGGASQPYTGPVALATPGDHTIAFRSTDNAGNVEAERTIRVKLDDAAPATTLQTSPAAPTGTNGWFTSAASFTLVATDATSGVATRLFRVDGGATQTFTGPVALAQGDHTVEYWSVDNAGNVEDAQTARLRLDTIAPTTTLATTPGSPDGTNGWFRRSSVGFTLAAVDATSGVATRRYTIDGGPEQVYTSAVAIASQGDHTVTYWSTDNAGNVEPAKTVHIKLDDVAPSVAVSLASAGSAVASGTTIYYRRNAPFSDRTLRLRATATDATSQPASASFPAIATSGWTHGAETGVTSPGSGVYDSAAFTWTTSSSTPGGYSVGVVDQAGNTGVQTVTFVNDATPPTGVVALGLSPVGALLTGTTLYYRSNAPGSFTLVDSVTDSGSGPASATFPAVPASGWTHAQETVTTGTGAPPTVSYPSSGYAWTAGAGAPSSSARTIGSADRVGNVGTTTLSFVVDNTGPTGGALRVNGVDATAAGSSSTSADGSFSIGVRSDYDADAGAGFESSVLTREQAPLSGGACGAFGAATTIDGSPAQSGLADGCYRYVLTGTDKLGNTSTLATTVEVSSPPVVTLVSVTNGGGFREVFNGTTSKLSGTITIECFWRGRLVQTYTFAATSSPWTFETEMWDLIVGVTYTARVRQTDADGNTSDWSDPLTFTGF